MVEGSSHHILNLKEIVKNDNNKFNIENFSPVIERIEEYASQSNEEQKAFSRQSCIKEEDNKAQLKDSVISQILDNLDEKENKKNKPPPTNTKSLFNQPKSTNLKQKKCLKKRDNTNNPINKQKKKISFNIGNKKPEISINFKSDLINSINNNKEEINIIRKNKRKTIATLIHPKRSSQILQSIENDMELSQNFQRLNNTKKKTCKENTSIKENNLFYIQPMESVETNQKLIKSKLKQTGVTLDNSRMTEDFHISSIIKNNKIQLAKRNSFKNLKLNASKEYIYMKSLLSDPNIKKNENLLKKLKFYSFLQSVSSLISILLCIIDIELYIKYSHDYIIKNKIEYKKLYEISKREINSKENIIRVLNCIFSFICVLMTFCIFFAKYVFNKKEKEKLLYARNRNFNFIYEYLNKTKIQKMSKRGQLSKIIIRLIINMSFCPPKANLIFYTYYNNILCIYPFNSFILLLASFKLYNIYRCIFYFIPLTATIGKTICQKHNVKLNIKFMFRTFLSKYKISFPSFVVVILIIIISILLKSVEFFSVDLSLSQNKKNSINLMENNLNIYDTLWIYLSFLLRNPTDDKKPKTPIGKYFLFIIYIFSSLFLCMIYYRLNYLIKLNRTSALL